MSQFRWSSLYSPTNKSKLAFKFWHPRVHDYCTILCSRLSCVSRNTNKLLQQFLCTSAKSFMLIIIGSAPVNFFYLIFLLKTKESASLAWLFLHTGRWPACIESVFYWICGSRIFSLETLIMHAVCLAFTIIGLLNKWYNWFRKLRMKAAHDACSHTLIPCLTLKYNSQAWMELVTVGEIDGISWVEFKYIGTIEVGMTTFDVGTIGFVCTAIKDNRLCKLKIMHVEVYNWLLVKVTLTIMQIELAVEMYSYVIIYHYYELTEEHYWCILSWSSFVGRDHSDGEVVVRIRMVNGVVQHGVPLYWHCIILSTGGVGDGDIVAQDGYPLQSEGRTPGDEDSSGVDGDFSEVTNWLQQTCMHCVNWQWLLAAISYLGPAVVLDHFQHLTSEVYCKQCM